MSVIRETLQQQRRILGFFHILGQGKSTLAKPYGAKHVHDIVNTYEERGQQDIGEFLEDPVTLLSATDPNGVQGLLIHDSVALVDKRIRDFKEMKDRASDLETWVSKLSSAHDSSRPPVVDTGVT
jgi:hypothetical protein